MPRINSRLTALVAAGFVAVLALPACGGDDGGASLTADQRTVADRAVSDLRAEGLEVDASCVQRAAAKLSAEDAAILAADPDADGVSQEGEDLAMEALACIDKDSFINVLVSQFDDSGIPIDSACVRNALSRLDMVQLISDETDSVLFDAIEPCFEDD